MEEEKIVTEDIPAQIVLEELNIDKNQIILPDVLSQPLLSGRGRKPKKKRGRPAWRHKVQIASDQPNKSSDLEENNISIETNLLENVSVKLEEIDTMVGKVEKKKLLDAMSEQFNSGKVNERPLVTTVKKRVKKGGRGRVIKMEPSDKFLEPTTFDEMASNLIKKEVIDEDLPESPTIEEESIENDPELPKSHKKSYPPLETSLLNRTKIRVGSQSPATGKESPISESSNDSGNSRSRGRLRQAIAEEMSSLNETKQLTFKRGRGRLSAAKLEQLKGIKTEISGRPKAIETEMNLGLNIHLKTTKKKKKHFKGLRYSFGIKKKKPKPKLNQSLNLFDSSQDNESLISEEVDADSFDSSSVETSSAQLSTGHDPYDPTEEFDDSNIAKKEPPLREPNKGEKSLEEGNLDVDEEQSWNAFPDDDEAGDSTAENDADIEQPYEESPEDMIDDYQDVNDYDGNQEEDFMDENKEQEIMEEEETQYGDEEDPDVNQEYGDLLDEEYEEEDVPENFDIEGNEEAIANGIEYMEDPNEVISETITYDTVQPEGIIEYDEQFNELDNQDYEEMEVEYAEEEEPIEYVDNESPLEEPNEYVDNESTQEDAIQDVDNESAQEELIGDVDNDFDQEKPIGDVTNESTQDEVNEDVDNEFSKEEPIEDVDNNPTQEEYIEEEQILVGDELNSADSPEKESMLIPANLYESGGVDENISDSQKMGSPEETIEPVEDLTPIKWKKISTKPKKFKKMKGRKHRKSLPSAFEPNEELPPVIGKKRRHSHDSTSSKHKKKKLEDKDILQSLVKEEYTEKCHESPIMIDHHEEDQKDVTGLEGPIKRPTLIPIANSDSSTDEKISPGEILNNLAEEDSTDTSEASINFKGDKLNGISRRISKRCNGDSAPAFVDEKDSRKSKRHNTLSSSGVLTLAARSDGKGYPKLVEEIDEDVANLGLQTALCKCRVNLNPKAANVTGEVYCQGFDCFDGRMIGCCNIIANDTYLRVSPKIPFMLLCNIHRQRLRRHNCCPGCGLFCTQGLFSECRWNADGIRHYYHKLCSLFMNGISYCPHCGTDQPPVEVHLELKLSRKPVIYLKQHQEKKGFVSSARMTCPTSKAQNQAADDKKMETNEEHLVLPNGNLISAVKLSIGLDRTRLEDAIQSIKAGKTFNIKVSAKAIYWACKYDDLEKLLWVLVSGLSPNAKVREYGNQTGLHTACMYGAFASAHVLVLAGACFDLTDTQLLTPLMVAISKGHNDLCSYLIQAGANLHARTDDGMTCLHLASKAGNYIACKHILDSGRLSRHTINVQDEGGWTPLVWASENRCINVVKLLLDRGADPQICDVEQNTALHWAAFSGSTHICSMVLERGCSLKSMNGIGDTPLHIAARQNHVEVVVQLLARGARLDVMNKRSQTPLNCCLPESESFLHITLNKKLIDVMRDNGIRTERILCSDIACGKESVPITCVNGVDDEELPKNYVYISENCEALNVNIDRTISSLKWCECRDGCNTENCVCSQLNFQCWYDPEGKLLIDFNYADPPMIFECNRACGCNKLSCHNRVVQHGITAHMQLFKTEGKGWGVRALKDIAKGSYVCEYVGEIITDLEADQREDDSYLFDLDNRDTETYCIDARQFANIARFINHICEPNLTPVKVFIDHQDLVFPRIAFFANRDIEADEELGFDYGEKFWVIKYKQFTCTCGYEKCKYSTETIHATLEAYNKKTQQHQQNASSVLV